MEEAVQREANIEEWQREKDAMTCSPGLLMTSSPPSPFTVWNYADNIVAPFYTEKTQRVG